MAAFSDFYHAQYGGRHLAWQTAMGTAEVRFECGDKVRLVRCNGGCAW